MQQTSRVFSPGRKNNFIDLPEKKDVSFLLSEQQGTGATGLTEAEIQHLQFYVKANAQAPNKEQVSLVSLAEEPVIVECSQIEDLSDISSVALRTDHGEVTLANALQDAFSQEQAIEKRRDLRDFEIGPSSTPLSNPINKKLCEIIEKVKKETA